IYGRRRIGKTYLVREIFKERFTFCHTGVSKLPAKGQLQAFYNSLADHGHTPSRIPRNWLEAFQCLSTYIKNRKEKRKVIFLDELPWMDTQKSDFLPAFEHFWNGWASARKDILLIVCGSATSWIIKNIVNNHGGLHNRLSRSIRLKQFTLSECEKYTTSLQMRMTRPQIIEAYMIFGGVPYYWSKLDRRFSLAQNIDRMFFTHNAIFKNEFNDLYASLFKHPEPYLKIISVLGKKKVGMTIEEISESTLLPRNGTLTKYLTDLEACGFIRLYSSYGNRVKGTVFQLIDNFTLFYYRFLSSKKITDEGYWSKIQTSTIYSNWCGLSFERICLLHIKQIKQALSIGGILSNEFSWRTPPYADLPGVEIDLLIERADKVFNLCEMKFTKNPFTIDKKYAAELQNKIARLRDVTSTRNAIFLTMISASGLTSNEYANDVQNVLTADDLFD
ncbi:MAG: AAA family ATPase, partial [Muribaculaceae bacterium]|nr:AAA family ATPase [Muribaculaceae bacterium]